MDGSESPAINSSNMDSFGAQMLFSNDGNFDILESGVAGELVAKVEMDDANHTEEQSEDNFLDPKTEGDTADTDDSSSQWSSSEMKTVSQRPRLFRTPTGLQRTSTYIHNRNAVVEGKITEFMDETSRAVSSVDEANQVDDSADVVAHHDEPKAGPSRQSVPNGAGLRPLRKLSLMIGKKLLRFKVVDAIRAADTLVPADVSLDRLAARHSATGSAPCLGAYKCAPCKVDFLTKEEWNKHINFMHSTKQFVCVLCGVGFNTKTSLSLHHKSHNWFPAVPRDRDRAELERTQMYQDMRNVRNPMQTYKPYQCTICSKSFSRAANHTLHMKMHQTGQRHFCHLCGRCFKKMELLADHQRTCESSMNGEYIQMDRPLRYQCSYCDKLFHHKRDKFIHERVHTGEKPYQCGYCGRGFTQSQGLTIHIRLHTGEKPYTCMSCGKQFRDNSALRKHEYHHHTPDNEMGGMYEPNELNDGLLDDDYSNSIWNDRA